jgi:hypothetical protein
MSDPNPAGAGRARPAPEPRAARVVDAQILANWQALRGNPGILADLVGILLRGD